VNKGGVYLTPHSQPNPTSTPHLTRDAGWAWTIDLECLSYCACSGTIHWLYGRHKRGVLACSCPSIDCQLKHDSFQAPSSLVCDKSGGEHD